MKHVRSITKPLPQDAAVAQNFLILLFNLLTSPLNFIFQLLGKPVQL